MISRFVGMSLSGLPMSYQGERFGVQGLWFRAKASGIEGQSLDWRVIDLGLRAWGLRSRV
jgi:hypothetical protein